MILGGVDEILQTIYHEGGELSVVAIDEESGKVRSGLVLHGEVKS